MTPPNDAKMRAIELAQMIKDAREALPLRIELFSVMAVEQKAKYDAYVSAGFSSDQAIQLCKG